MNKERMPENDDQQKTDQPNTEKQPRSSGFNESVNKDRKQTTNPEEEADLEQQRKEAMRERD
jgi:hypothetical protein